MSANTRRTAAAAALVREIAAILTQLNRKIYGVVDGSESPERRRYECAAVRAPTPGCAYVGSPFLFACMYQEVPSANPSFARTFSRATTASLRDPTPSWRATTGEAIKQPGHGRIAAACARNATTPAACKSLRSARYAPVQGLHGGWYGERRRHHRCDPPRPRAARAAITLKLLPSAVYIAHYLALCRRPVLLAIGAGRVPRASVELGIDSDEARVRAEREAVVRTNDPCEIPTSF